VRSLRARLFVFLLALAAFSALAVGGATYVSVRAEADALFDYHLQQMALSLRDQGRIADDERTALANPALDYVVQVWSADGVVLYSSRPRGPGQTLPPRAVLGFSDLQIGDAPWRVYGAATPLRVVQVGQPLAVRRNLAAAAAGRSVWPIAVAAPVVALGLWWLVGLSLAPLAQVVAAAQLRGAGSLAPLPSAGLPTELAPLVAAFNALLARLADAFDAQRSFVADAAHELRTPLTALKLQLDLLATAAPGAEHEAALVRLRAGVDRATHLVTQLLALARAEPGRALPTEPLDLVAVARDALQDAAPLAATRGATLTLDAPETVPLAGDAQAWRSALRNLLDNAVHHGGASPRVQMQIRSGADGVHLWLDDSGPGIPLAEREQVFHRFQRRADDGGAGSGLGLAIVRAVAAQHGADVALSDSPLGGLRVELHWPAPA
jgi:two-component system OmpR family sensor kinase/two-component system sensor histidine kinase QseC